MLREPADPEATRGGRRPPGGGAKRIGLLFVLSAAASAGLTVVYALGGHVQLEGALLGIALGGIAVGLILWAHRLMPKGPYTEEREMIKGKPEQEAETEDAFVHSVEAIERRGVLGWLLGLAGAALAAAAVFPVRSLGRAPGGALYHTAWRRGSRLVLASGRPVRADEVDVNTVLTVFPEGHTDAADSQTLLIRLREGEYPAPAGRKGWSPEGFVAFSKVCTHAGCPVGLYQADTKELFCPCHQSVFAVLEAAKPTQGPATRPLPQLPLSIDDDGFLYATGDFPEAIGPGFWSRPNG